MLIDLDRAKNEIIREISSSSEFLIKIKNLIKRNGFKNNNGQVYEDIIQEVVLKSLEKDSFEVYELYIYPKKNGDNRVLGYMLGIAKMLLLDHPKGYSNHNISTKLKHMSNLKEDNDVFGSCTVTYSPEYGEEENEEYDEQKHALYQFFQFLDEDEKEFLLNDMDRTITRGKYTREYSEQKEIIFEKIRQIAKDKKIII